MTPCEREGCGGTVQPTKTKNVRRCDRCGTTYRVPK